LEEVAGVLEEDLASVKSLALDDLSPKVETEAALLDVCGVYEAASGDRDW
jgi:hypothetical protein